ncbi:DUF3325 family protein [Catenovulum sp. 2E275]|uniref:DUF3325 family protein n=1 Tax=Catenovulum sp. 2E275 TaxID=2980497 RepID=UPI0021CE74FA|nr:DUF3325 family protein [Catenovulum sp. 2E275]MCU4675388.1 DUF3325 family protein [Catenovulum sp. 2E275]
MINLFIWIMSGLGFLILCLLTPSHRKVFNLKMLADRQEKAYQWIGLGLILLSFIACFFSVNIADAIINWFGILTFSALFIALVLSFKQSQLQKRKQQK